MTRAGRFFRNLVERLLGRYYEGPPPPRRLEEQVRLFAVYYPRATRAEWTEFATRIAATAYRDGFVRGYEWQERGWEGPRIDPEVLAEERSHDWSLAEQHPRLQEVLAQGIDPRDPLAGIDEDRRVEFLDELGRRAGTYRVVVSPPERPPRHNPGDG